VIQVNSGLCHSTKGGCNDLDGTGTIYPILANV